LYFWPQRSAGPPSSHRNSMSHYICEECCREFHSNRFSLYCSTDCRNRAAYERRRKGTTHSEKRIAGYALRNCFGCSVEFKPVSLSQRYCTRDCYNRCRRGASKVVTPVTAGFSFVSKTADEYQSTTLRSQISGPTEFEKEVREYLASGGGVTVLGVATSQSRGVVRTNQVADDGLMIEGLWL